MARNTKVPQLVTGVVPGGESCRKVCHDSTVCVCWPTEAENKLHFATLSSERGFDTQSQSNSMTRPQDMCHKVNEVDILGIVCECVCGLETAYESS
jgi:hypothetical protein